MKKIAIILTVLAIVFVNIDLNGQENGNIGIVGGSSNYFGELNYFIPFMSPSFYGGMIYRHNFNYRYSFRFGVYLVNLRGSSKLSTDPYQQTLRRREFSYYFGEVHLGGEFNFFRFDNHKFKQYYFTPYIVGGVSFITVPDPYYAFDFSFPVGFGVKYAFNEKVTIGAEITYDWTYSDFLDRIKRDDYYTIQTSYNTNPDSYSLIGVYITYQLFRHKPPCPVYTYY